MRVLFILTTVLALGIASPAWSSEDVGCVSTNIRMLGIANDKICIAAFNDPDVQGVTCYISRAVTGGAKGLVGLAEDTSDASISCHQTGPITLGTHISDGDKVFKESRSFLFKKLQVVRFFDKDHNTLVYLSYSDRLIDGSPKNSISAVPIIPWAGK